MFAYICIHAIETDILKISYLWSIDTIACLGVYNHIQDENEGCKRVSRVHHGNFLGYKIYKNHYMTA